MAIPYGYDEFNLPEDYYNDVDFGNFSFGGGFPEPPQQYQPPAQQQQPAGGGYDRQAFQNAWLSSGWTGDVADWLNQNQNVAQGVQAVSKDKVLTPGYTEAGTGIWRGPEELDLLRDVGGANQPVWGGYGASSVGGQAGGPMPSGQGGEIGGSAATSSSSRSPLFGDMGALTDALKGLFPGGAFNQGIVNRRTENASEGLNRQRKSRLATNRAALAERGLIGDGPEMTAMNNMEEDLYGQFTNAVSGIYADESENADARMIQALQIAAGLSSEEASNLVDWFRAQTERSLGQGQLDLGNRRAGIEESLGMGQLDLGRDRLDFDSDSAYWDWLLRANDNQYGGAGISSGGYR